MVCATCHVTVIISVRFFWEVGNSALLGESDRFFDGWLSIASRSVIKLSVPDLALVAV
jgi:hypothetical protein